MMKMIHAGMLVSLAIGLLCGSGCERTDGGRGLAGGDWSTKDQSIPHGGARPLGIDPPQLGVASNLATESAAELRQAAIDLLLQAADSTNAQLRAHAIEALHHAPREVLEPVVRRGLGDPNRGVRFIATMTVGRFAFAENTHLLLPLLDDESQSVRAAAIFALWKCGEPVDPTPLASMVRSSDTEVRGNAAIVLGEMGHPSAVQVLRSAAGQGLERVSPARAKIADLQIAEAMVRLGDDRQLEVIRASLFAPPGEQGELVALACLMCGKLRDERAAPTLLDFARREGRMRMPAEIRMAAARALAEIDPERAPIEVPLQYIGHGQFQLRAQAAATLGAMGRQQDAASALSRLLSDDNPLVQVHAAGGILESSGWGETVKNVQTSKSK